jgi:surface antigen
MYAMRLAQAAAAGLALLVVAPPAPAQWRDMRPEGASMTREDLDHQRASTQALLEAEPPPVGRSREWHNTETGAHGTVTMLRAFENRGAPCRAMRYAVMTRGRGQPVETTFTLCRTADGEWKIAS